MNVAMPSYRTLAEAVRAQENERATAAQSADRSQSAEHLIQEVFDTVSSSVEPSSVDAYVTGPVRTRHGVECERSYGTESDRVTVRTTADPQTHLYKRIEVERTVINYMSTWQTTCVMEVRDKPTLCGRLPSLLKLQPYRSVRYSVTVDDRKGRVTRDTITVDRDNPTQGFSRRKTVDTATIPWRPDFALSEKGKKKEADRVARVKAEIKELDLRGTGTVSLKRSDEIEQFLNTKKAVF